MSTQVYIIVLFFFIINRIIISSLLLTIYMKDMIERCKKKFF